MPHSFSTSSLGALVHRGSGPFARSAERAGAPRWLVASVLVAAAASLSALQIWLRQSVAAGQSHVEPSPLVSLALSNLVAWAPWVPLGLAISWLSRLLLQESRGRLLAGHALGAQTVAWGFLGYLAVFRAVFLPEIARPYLEEGWLRLVAREAADFYLVCVLLYAAIALWSTSRSGAPRGPGAEKGRAHGERPRAGSLRIEVRGTSRTRWVRSADVEWLEAAGNYTRLHTKQGSILHRQPLKEMLAALVDEGFVRVHRSHAVRLTHVESVGSRAHGDGEVKLRGGGTLRVSRRYRAELVAGMASLGVVDDSSHGRSRSSQRA